MASMQSRQPGSHAVPQAAVRARAWGPFAALLALALAGCRFVAAPPPFPAPLALLGAEPRLVLAPSCLPRGDAAAKALEGRTALVLGGAYQTLDGTMVLADDAEFDPGLVDPAALAAVRAFLAAGGRVLLLSRALALAHALGLEERAPDQAEEFRFGFDASTARGQARLGFQFVTARAADFEEGLVPAAGRPHGHYFVFGAPLRTPICAYTHGLARGEALGQLLVERDGEAELRPASVFVRWRLGRGEVLGLGLELDPRSVDAAAGANVRALAASLLRWLGPEQRAGSVACWPLPSRPHEAPPPQLDAWSEREVPGAPLLAHWGLLAPVHDEPALSTQAAVDEIVLPSHLMGASCVALDLMHPTLGLPLAWSSSDPIARPKDYVGQDRGLGYGGLGMQDLCRQAHVRGMLVAAQLDPPPGGSERRAQLASLRYVARQWADLRRLDDGAIDGLWLRRWFADPQDLALAMFQDFLPSARLVGLGERFPAAGPFARGVDARDGQPLGLRAMGIAGRWRQGHPAARFPVGVLDASAMAGPGAAVAWSANAGGSYPDWLIEQAHSFVRPRRGLGSAMLWSWAGASSLQSDAIDYLGGLSNEPLTAAVAARCSALGQDGYRSAQLALVPEVDPAFGCGVEAPAAALRLQNNRLRLFSGGGRLEYDPTGLADFAGGSAVILSPGLLRTRLFGARPDIEEARSLRVDLLAQAGVRGAVVALQGGKGERRRIEFALPADRGLFRLRIQVQAVRGRGVLCVGMDQDPLFFLPFAEGRLGLDRELPLHLARADGRRLWIEAVDGGAASLHALLLQRVGDVASEGHVTRTAGCVAGFVEHTSSSYHDESTEFVTLADFPALLVRTTFVQAARNLQVERRLGPMGHRRLGRHASGEDARMLRGPFVLEAQDAGLPDVAVVPLELSRYESFRLDDEGLVLSGQTEPGARCRFGLVLLPRAEMARAFPHLATMLLAMHEPAAAELPAAGIAEFRSELPVAWTRAVRLEQRSKTPFLVREGGYWTWRGAQPLADGSCLLRVRHLPGDTVRILGGQELYRATRPGPGALSLVALRDPGPRSVRVRVLQRSPLAWPAVTMAEPFDEVFVDGRPWSWFDGQTVFLPTDADECEVVTRSHGGERAPHVRSSGAALRQCAYDPASRTLRLVARAEPGRSSSQPFVAIVSGPRPAAVDGGALVGEDELRHEDALTARAAAQGGVVVRFSAGLVTLRYRAD